MLAFTRQQLEDLLLRGDFLAQCAQKEVYDRLLGLSEHVIAMAGFDQKNPHHIYNVLTHSLHTVDAVRRDDLREDEYRLLRVAALFHDIGKPLTFRERTVNGRIRRSFHGHALMSAKISEPIFIKLGYEDDERRLLLFVIANHDWFIDFRRPDETPVPNHPVITAETVRKAVEAMRKKYDTDGRKVCDMRLLLPLMKADVSAQAPVVTDEYGVKRDSRANKLSRIKLIEELLNTES